jgi:hypothetical protein
VSYYLILHRVADNISAPAAPHTLVVLAREQVGGKPTSANDQIVDGGGIAYERIYSKTCILSLTVDLHAD